MPWVDLSDAKAHLNKTTSADDGELEGFVFSACDMVEELMGHVEPIQVTSTCSALLLRTYTHHGERRQWLVDLPETPVLSITSVTQGSTLVDPSAYSLSDSVLTVPGPGCFTVVYMTGRNPVPENYRLAALELVAHLWRGSQLNQGNGRPQNNGDQMQIVPAYASAMPYRVRELLGLYGDVVSAHPVIA